MPLYRYLYDLGKEVVLANFSFTDLVATGSVMMSQGLYPITEDSNDLTRPQAPAWGCLLEKQ
jgi:hypothetical protein